MFLKIHAHGDPVNRTLFETSLWGSGQDEVPLRQAGTWNLGPFAVVLAPGQTSPRTTEYKQTIKN